MPGSRHHRLYVVVLAIVGTSTPSLTIAQGPGPTPVVVAPVTSQELPPTLRLVGTVRPERTAVVATEVSGIVATFEAEEGQFLKPGDVICRLDPVVARLRVEEAQATLAGREATLDELERGERPEELARLQALVQAEEAVAAKWDFERRRMQALFEREQCNEKEKVDADMDHASALGRLAQARAQYEKARNGPRAEERARARQAVLAAKATLARLQRDLDKTQIRAPFAGAIVAKRTDVGAWVDAGGAVCEFIGMDMVKARVDVPEGAVGFARVGEPATVEVEALRRTFSAPITRVIPQANAAARTFPVEIDLLNTEHAVLPGMFVWAHVPSGPREARLLVPKDAIVSQGLARQLYVVRAGEGGAQLAVPMPVTTGLELADRVEVQAAGLQAGDLVVTRGNERLFGPTPIIPQTAPPLGPEGGDASAGAAKP